jgi:hypothetical protein
MNPNRVCRGGSWGTLTCSTSSTFAVRDVVAGDTEPRRRVRRRAALAGSILGAAVIGVLAIGSPSALAAPPTSLVFVQSATAGTAHHGRLTLRGVGRNVAWFTNGSNKGSGERSFAVMKRALFSRGQPAPLATLAVGGRLAVVGMTLSQPRFNARRHVVTYRVRRRGKRPLPRRFAHAVLTIIVPGSSGGNAPGRVGSGLYIKTTCTTTFTNNTPNPMVFLRATKFDTDDWLPPMPLPDPTGKTTRVYPGGSFTWSTTTGYSRSCGNSMTWQPQPLQGGPSPYYKFETGLGWDGSKVADSCNVTEDATGGTYHCTQVSSTRTFDASKTAQHLVVVWSATKTPSS